MRFILTTLIALNLLLLPLFASAQSFRNAGLGLRLPSDVLRTLPEPRGYAPAADFGVHLLRHYRPGRRLIERPFIIGLSYSNRPKVIYALSQRSHARRTARHHRRRH